MMERISQTASLVYRGLFLREEAYEEMRQAHNPFVEGLFVLVVIGLGIAVAGIIGITLQWASSPDLAAVQQTVYDGITNMPWYEQLTEAIGPDFVEPFQAQWRLSWDVARAVAPAPLSSLARLITTPAGLIISWLVYGLLAHLFARLLGGEANLGQTLGTTGLAMAPHLLSLLGLLPFVTVGGVVGTWVLICRYVALKQAHRLSWGRAFWATVLPRLVMWLLALVAIGVGIAVFGALLPQLADLYGG